MACIDLAFALLSSQDFELELVGSHTMKVQVCSKSLLKEETYAQGKVRVWREGAEIKSNMHSENFLTSLIYAITELFVLS